MIKRSLTLMPFARLFATFYASFGPVFPPKALPSLFSKTFFLSSSFNRRRSRTLRGCWSCFRGIDKEIQQGQRNTLGREKKALRKSRIPRMLAVVIGASQEISAAARARPSSRLEAYYMLSN